MGSLIHQLHSQLANLLFKSMINWEEYYNHYLNLKLFKLKLLQQQILYLLFNLKHSPIRQQIILLLLLSSIVLKMETFFHG